MISFVVPTVNKSKTLSSCIESILQLLEDGDEIIIVHQGENMDSNHAFITSNKIKIQHISSMGLSKARNAGAHVAQNDIIAFIDDDMLLDKDYAQNIKKHLQKDIYAICGRILTTDNHSPYAKVHDNKQIIITPSLFKIKRCLGGNMVFRKQPFLTVGGFDPSFGIGTVYGGAEDIDIVLRLMYNKKNSILYAPDVISYHPREGKIDHNLFLNKMYLYGMGEGAVYAKHYYKHKFSFIIINYLMEVAKPAIRIILSLLLINFKKIGVYSIILKGRFNGFFAYRNELRKNKI